MILFMIPGAIFLFVGIALLAVDKRIRAKRALCTAVCKGVISEHKIIHSWEHSDGGGYCTSSKYACYRFILDGVSYEQTCSESGVKGFPVGAEVLVHYNPEDPKQSYIKPVKVTKIVGIVFLAFGLLFMLLFAVLTVVLFGGYL